MPSRSAQRRDGHRRDRTDYLDRYIQQTWAMQFDAWLRARFRPVEPPAPLTPATPEGNKE